LGFEYLGLGAANGQPVIRVVGATRIADGSWHHVAAVYDQNSVCLYVDGVPDGSVAASGVMGIGVEGIQFGGEETPAADTAGVCLLDDIRVYHLALESDGIGALYEAGNKALADQFSVSAGRAAPCGYTDTPLKMDAIVRSNADSLAERDISVQWRRENGPGEVSFRPNQNVIDPCVCFGAGAHSIQPVPRMSSMVRVTVYRRSAAWWPTTPLISVTPGTRLSGGGGPPSSGMPRLLPIQAGVPC
jgi:hypothetical protein